VDTGTRYCEYTPTGLDDRDYQLPFTFTGKINKVTFKPGPPEFLPEDTKQAAQMKANADN
jgi:arylsulfatase